MVHKGPPDRKGGGGLGFPKLDQNKGSSNITMAAGCRRQHQHQQQKHLNDGYKAAAAAAIADMKQVLKKARSMKRISDSLKQVEQQLRTPSPVKKTNRRLDTDMMLTPAPATRPPGAAGWSGPNYMKATTSSDARTGKQQQPQQQVSRAQPLFATPADKRHPITTPKPLSSKTPPPPRAAAAATTTPKKPKTLLLTRKPSLKLVIPGTAIDKSLVVAAPLFEHISVSKATCSSILKDSKFPNELELIPGGTQLEGTSAVRVCPYTYCSLNGHHAPAVPLRYFLSAKRRMIKAQKGVKIRRLPSPPRKRVVVITKEAAGIELLNGLENETSPQSTVLDERNDDCFLEIYVNTNQGAANRDSAFHGGQRLDREGEVNNGDDDNDNGNDAQGREANQPPRVSQDDVDLDTMNPGIIEMNLVDDIIDRLSEISISEMEIPARFMVHGDESLGQEGTPDADIFFTSSTKGDIGKHKSDDGFALGEFLQQQQPVREQPSLTPSEAIEVDCQEEMPEYADDGAADDEEHDQATAGENDDDNDRFMAETLAEDHDAAMDSECRTGFYINRKGREEDNDQLIRGFNPRGPNFLPLEPEPEAEKIDLRHHMLDEKKNSEEQEHGGSEAIINDNIVAGDHGHSDADNRVPSKDITPVAEDETGLSCPEGKGSIRRASTKPEQPEMDSESRLKLVINRRSHQEDVEELTEFNPRGPNFLPVEPDTEAEKVDLRHLMMDDRKNAEEWMVDYALQRAVSKLAPARKKKVALLVEAFETVAPPLPIYKANPARQHSGLGFAHARPMQACS